MHESSIAPLWPAVVEDVGVPSADRQQVSAGARASPSWIGGRRRPTRVHYAVHAESVKITR
jgi:hypothetical protein